MWFGIFHPLDSKANTCCPVWHSPLVRVGCCALHLCPAPPSVVWLGPPCLSIRLRVSSPLVEMGLSWLGLWLKRLGVFLQVAVEVAVGKVFMTLFPERAKRNILAMGQKTGMAGNPRFSPDNWVPTFFSIQYFWFVLKVRWQRLEDRAEYGGLAPNCTVVRLSGQKCNIWDFIQGQQAASAQGLGAVGAGRVERCIGKLQNFRHCSCCFLWGLPSCSVVGFSEAFSLGWHLSRVHIKGHPLWLPSPWMQAAPLQLMNFFSAFRLTHSATSCKKPVLTSPGYPCYCQLAF